MNFQLCNVEAPNSPKNTCVFAAFEATDTLTNLHISLDCYSDQVTELQNMQWRYAKSYKNLYRMHVKEDGIYFQGEVYQSLPIWGL